MKRQSIHFGSKCRTNFIHSAFKPLTIRQGLHGIIKMNLSLDTDKIKTGFQGSI
ncbi:hypothetical protein [Desulfobacter hydrogenophilus]|uniref:hypothetical protein n=1 Tax=Desulfobacter hydrogenophilus TaxID=2291 RepID=UPI0013EF60FE|nr:hypothetical protein [Desulfobacter hydrogenophilus]